MIQGTSACILRPDGGHGEGRTGAGRLAPALLAGLLLLGGCDSSILGGQPAVSSAAPAVPADPLVAFAAQAAPGTERRVVLVDGSPALVRLTRSYYAASGRECRELLVGSGMAQRVQLVCSGDDGAWNTARPLLPGGGLARR
jgi:hypothetical protein